MADNYLEKRMEEYRSGRLATRSHTTPSMRAPKRTDTLTLIYMPMRVVMFATDCTPLLEAVVAAFAAVGCKVAFTASGTKEGTALAQRTGARYYPSTFTAEAIVADVTSRWGEPEVTVVFDEGCHVAAAGRVIDISRHFARLEASPLHLARHVLYLAHPDNAFLLAD